MTTARDIAPHYTSGCEGKTRHSTRAAATRALADIQARHLRGDKRGRLHPYRCVWCESWHLGKDTSRKGRP